MTEAELWGSAVPSWIMAMVGFLTLCAAIVAGYFAGRAAQWTKAQAIASNEQVRLAGLALVAAEEDSKASRAQHAFERTEAERSARRSEEMRLDRLLPSVLLTAHPGSGALGGGSAIDLRRWSDASQSWGPWDELAARTEFEPDEQLLFRMTVKLVVENLSDIPARVDFVDLYNGSIDEAPSGRPLFLGAKVTKSLIWERIVGSGALKDEGGVNLPENALFRPELWVRDLGMNIRETYRISASLNHFARNGTRLVASPLPLSWPEAVAVPVERQYDRLI